MKATLVRIAIYIPIISLFWWVLVPGFFSGPLSNSTALGAAGFYIAYYGITYGFWIAAYELCYRTVRYMRKTKAKSEEGNT